MKRLNIVFSILLIVTMLSGTMLVEGSHGPRDGHHNGPGDGGPMTGPGGFSGGMGDMVVSGDISVDEAIIIDLTVTPDEAMQERMNEHHRDHHRTPADMTNTMSVRIDSLVEYLDNDNNGYTSNDTVIGEFALNSTNLGEPEITTEEDGTTYTITSNDGSFVMYLHLNEKDGVPHSWKWSVEINYDFLSPDSSLAITQSVMSNGGQHMGRHGSHMDQAHMEGRINQSRFEDGHQHVPLFFSWDETAVVDNQTVDITASFVDDSISISFPQGDTIFYDPEIGVELVTLESVNQFLNTAFQSLAESLNSPTVLGLLLATGLLVSFVAIVRLRS